MKENKKKQEERTNKQKNIEKPKINNTIEKKMYTKTNKGNGENKGRGKKDNESKINMQDGGFVHFY